MSKLADVVLWCAPQLISAHWADVDENGGQTAHESYLPDAVYIIGNNRFEGQDKIEAFYAKRRYGTVVARHVVWTVRVIGENSRRARTLGLMTLYRADGKSPLQGVRPPAMIADLMRSAYWEMMTAFPVACAPAVYRGWRPSDIDCDPATGS